MPRPTKQSRELERSLVKELLKQEDESSEEEQEQQGFDFGALFGEGEEGEGGFPFGFFGEGEEGDNFVFGEGEDATGGFDFASIRDEMKVNEDEAKHAIAAALEAEKADKKVDPTKPLQDQKMDFYEILGVDRAADEKAITKAYKKHALQFHPDRNVGKSAKERDLSESNFAYLGKIYQTLLDQRKRALYDKHGELKGNDMSEGFLNSYELWTTMFPGVTPTDTELFKAKYQDSEEEYADVVDAFNKANGDLFLMMSDLLFFSDETTYERDRDMVLMLIEKGRIKNTNAIKNFLATHEKTIERLKNKKEDDDEMYKQFEQLAYQRALKKAKNGVVTPTAQQSEMVSLMNQYNRSKQSTDMVEGIAQSLGEQEPPNTKKRKK